MAFAASIRQVLWRRAEDLFYAALERSPEDRGAFLDEACGDETELRQQVEQFVSNEELAGSFLEETVLAGVTDPVVTRRSAGGATPRAISYSLPSGRRRDGQGLSLTRR